MSDILLTVQQLGKSIANQPLFAQVRFGISKQQRLGLIGDNGTGKSTLLKIIAHQIPADEGKVMLSQSCRLAYLPQRPVLIEETIQAALAQHFAPLQQHIERYERCQDVHEQARLLEVIEQMGGWHWQHHLERVAQEMGLDDLQAPTAKLSGGQQKRVALARLMLARPNLVLLDEPTNHLDTQTIERLEQWLINEQLAALLVTHDRYVLDSLVDDMLELRDGTCKRYVGGYAQYLMARATQEELADRARAKQQQLAKVELAWLARSPQARTTKSQARVDRAEALQEAVRLSQGSPDEVQFQFGPGPRLGKSIVQMQEMVLKIGERSLCQPFSLQLQAGQRWGILGPNGIGKTTLLQAIAGQHPVASGRMICGKNNQLLMIDQHRTALDPMLSVRQLLLPLGGEYVHIEHQAIHIQQWLQQFGFSRDMLSRRVGTCSGGEQYRLVLAKTFQQPCNLLLLDEPTNDLDIWTMAWLEQLLLRFSGCMLVVSHDRYFLNKIATGILAFLPEAHQPSRLEVVLGNYDDWLMFRQQEQRQAKEHATEQRSKPVPLTQAASSSSTSQGLSFVKAHQLSKLEKDIEAHEQEQQQLEQALAVASIWQEQPEHAKALTVRHLEVQHQLEQLYEQWETLQSPSA